MRINSVNYVTFSSTNVIIKYSNSGETCHNPAKALTPPLGETKKQLIMLSSKKQEIRVKWNPPPPPFSVFSIENCYPTPSWECGERTVLLEERKHLCLLLCLVPKGRNLSDSKSINSPVQDSSAMINRTEKIILSMLVKFRPSRL